MEEAKATFKQVTDEEYKSTMAKGALYEKAQIELLRTEYVVDDA